MLITLEEKVDPRHAALIVVDMQNDFCHSDGAIAKQDREVSFSQQMTPKLLNLLAQSRREKLPVIFIRQINNDWYQSETWREHRRRVNPGKPAVPCLEGTWGAEFYQVSPQPGECIVTKHRYSAFASTDLDLILRSRGIKTLIMTGVQTNACVESTAREGLIRDYYIVFVKDCTATEHLDDHEATLRNIRNLFGIVVISEEVISAWAKIRKTLSPA